MEIIVATPGRLDDLFQRYDFFDLRELEVLVLDEADTLLSMGFAAAIGTARSRHCMGFTHGRMQPRMGGCTGLLSGWTG